MFFARYLAKNVGAAMSLSMINIEHSVISMSKVSDNFRAEYRSHCTFAKRGTTWISSAPLYPRTASLLKTAMTEAYYGQAAANSGSKFDFANRIKRLGIDTRESRELSARLLVCNPNHRCHSPACYRCGKIEQTLLARLVEEFVAHQSDRVQIAFATIIPANSSVPKGSLRAFSLPNLKRRVRDGLAKTSANWAVGSVDFSLNAQQAGKCEPFWSPHTHLILGAGNIDELKSELRAAFRRNKEAARPVVVQEWDGNANAFAYLFKPNFNRRITIENCQRFNPKTMQTRFCTDTTNDRLRIAESVELAQFIDAIGFGGRLLLRNLRLCQADNSIGLELRLTGPP
jgi:hypothetical protein